jgi:5-methylcytosine-specific restriction endonuclease McrA
MPFDYSRYPSSWSRIRHGTLRRALSKCECCGAKNGEAHPLTGSKVVLTIAHLGKPFALGGDEHDEHDIRVENLAALCQHCHLGFDALDYAVHARKTRERKRQAKEPFLTRCSK